MYGYLNLLLLINNNAIAICIIGTICSPPRASIHYAQLVWKKWPLNLEYCFSYYMGMLAIFF
ncbi:hypothetical protein T09_3301 [Trichinella sp. T9]|nr:hypothetical protein T09_3301 [Trichinella sp. T9]